jgi:hypothetical protein
MTIVARSRRAGLLAAVMAVALVGVSSAAAEPLSDDQQQQVAAVMAAAGNGLIAVDRVLLQVRTAHEKVLDYQDPKRPDPALKVSNAMEIDFVNRLEEKAVSIGKEMNLAHNLTSRNGQYEPLEMPINSLIKIDNDLVKLQEFLGRPDVIATRNKTLKHLTAVLDGWSAAHPGADTELVAEMRAMLDPQQIDDALQSQRSLVTQVIEVLNSVR